MADLGGTRAARQSILLASYEMQNELSNEKRFEKAVVGALEQVRNGMGDGLFTVRPSVPVRAYTVVN